MLARGFRLRGLSRVNALSFHSTPATYARILATDKIDDVCVQIFKNRGHDVDFVPSMPEDELCKVIGQYDAAVIRSATKFTPKVFEHATNLQIVGRAGVGVDNIDIPAATKAGVMVMNTPGGNTTSTAQLALSLMCAVARTIPAADMSVKAERWDRKLFKGTEIMGKTLGIIGCGRIGQEVAASATAMGMKIIGYDPVMSPEDFKAAGIARGDLEDIWKQSDFITLHTPLVDSTRNLLNDETINMCKDGVRIVNCARGGIVEEAALLRGLNSGKVAGAALDVYTQEPPGPELAELIAHPNLVCTPHLGASTEEAQINVARDVADQICDVFEGKSYVGILNVSFMQTATQEAMQPFMNLAELIGKMQSQITGSKPTEVILKTWGGRVISIAEKQARSLLEAMVLKGLMHEKDNVSLIAAPFVAKEEGIVSKISEDPPRGVGSPYWNIISVTCKRENGETTVIKGAVFGNTGHIVSVNSYKDLFAFVPATKHILTFENEDKPGAISDVLSILHEGNVNVASVNVAQRTDNDSQVPMAYCFMSCDGAVPVECMDALRQVPALTSVSQMML